MNQSTELNDDIDALKAALAQSYDSQGALKKSVSHLRTVIKNLPVIVFSLDSEGTFTLSEGKELELLGREPGEVVGESIFDVYKDKPEIMENISLALKGQSVEYVHEMEDFFFEVRYQPVFDNEQNVKAVVGILEKITALMHAEQALRESENRNQALLNVIPDLIFHFNSSGDFLDYRGAAYDALALSPEAFISKNVRDVMPSELAELCVEFIQKTLSTGKTQTFEYELEVPADSEDIRNFEARMVVLREGEVMAVVRDITTAVRNQQALLYVQVERARLEVLNQTAVALAHNIRNAMTPIAITAEMLRPDNPKSIERLKGIIRSEGQRIEAVIRVLLRISESGEIPVTDYLDGSSTKMLDLNQLTDEEVQRIASEKKSAQR